MNPFTAIRTLLPVALLAVTVVGCGISKEEVQAMMDPLQQEHNQLSSEVNAAIEQFSTEGQQVTSQAANAVEESKSFVRGEIQRLDEKYERYNRDAQTFKVLTDDITQLRDENIRVYDNLREALDGLRRLMKTERGQIDQRREILIYLIDILDSNIQRLEELTGARGPETPPDGDDDDGPDDGE